MDNENNKIVEETSSANGNTQSMDITNTGETIGDKSAVEASNTDISKIKIRTILKERFKNSRPMLKKLAPFIIVGLLSFMAGFGVDRLLVKNNLNKGIQNRPVIKRNFQNRRFNGRQGSSLNYKYMPNER